MRDLPERQRTLRATLDWSHDLLLPAEQVAFRRLSVFAGGFTLESAEAVVPLDDIAAGDVLRLLCSLVDQSLVTVRASADGGPSRYGMLEPVRVYARERLDVAGEDDAVRSPCRIPGARPTPRRSPLPRPPSCSSTGPARSTRHSP